MLDWEAELKVKKSSSFNKRIEMAIKNLIIHSNTPSFQYFDKMKKIVLLHILFMFIGILSWNSVYSQTLKHSYTFDNNTAQDQIGEADGTMHGGVIQNGSYTASLQGNYLSLPADYINIQQYQEISIEAFIETPSKNASNTMLIYFGRSTPSGFGADYLFFSAKNGGSTKTGISCLNNSEPWTSESNLSTVALEDGDQHHIVVTLGYFNLTLFIDGNLIATTKLASNNKSANLSNELIYLCKGGYTSDPSWLGSIDEFNIYEGIISDADVQVRATAYFSSPKIRATKYGQIDNLRNQITFTQ
jgi:hypothetical protein